MKIIMKKLYVDIAARHGAKREDFKTYNGIMEVSENDIGEIVVDINDMWLMRIVDLYAESCKVVVGMIKNFQFVFESVQYKAEKITAKFLKSGSDTEMRKAA